MTLVERGGGDFYQAMVKAVGEALERDVNLDFRLCCSTLALHPVTPRATSVIRRCRETASDQVTEEYASED